MHNELTSDITGYVCPRCGGAISRLVDGGDGAEFRCRIDHSFTPEQMWREHCAARNQAIATAARFVAENADLAYALAERARGIGQDALAARLEEEARSEEANADQLLRMLEGLLTDDGPSGGGPIH